MINGPTLNNALTRANSAEIANWGIPDYTAGVTYTGSFTAPSDGYCLSSQHIGDWATTGLELNGITVDAQHNQTATNNILSHTRCFVKKGDTITKSAIITFDTVVFFPLIGV